MQTENSLVFEDKIACAHQNAKVLLSEVERARQKLKDTSLSESSYHISPIPPKRYIKLYNTLKGHRNKISQIKWDSTSSRIVSACQDGFMIIWDAVTGLKLQAIPLEDTYVLCCAFSPSGSLVASAGLDNRCTIYKVNVPEPGAPTTTQPGTYELSELSKPYRAGHGSHAAYVSACEFIEETKILTASGDMTIALWDTHKGCRAQEYLGHKGDVFSMSVRPSERMFLSAGADGTVKVWDLRERGPVMSCKISQTDVQDVVAFDEGNAFVAGADDGICRLFDLRSECELASYELSTQFSRSNKGTACSTPVSSHFDTPGVVSLDMSKSNRVLYACYADYGCIAWDVLKNDIIESIGMGMGSGSHNGRVSQVAVSPDGEGLATASWDSTIKVWST